MRNSLEMNLFMLKKDNPEENCGDKTTIICRQFRELFPGREDCWGKLKGGCRREKLTEMHYLKHLKGEESLGIYPLLDDGTCKFAVIDFDFKDKEDKENLTRQNAERIIYELGLIGIAPCWLEISRSGLAHVWIFFDKPVKAKSIRKVIGELLEKIGIQVRNGQCEIFPKQDSLVPGQVGNYINLPYFGGLNGTLDKRVVIDASNSRPLELEEFTNEATKCRASREIIGDIMIETEEVELIQNTRKNEPNKRLSVENIWAITEIVSPYWREGQRNDLAMYLSGFLAKHGIIQDNCLDIVTMISGISGDEEVHKRKETVRDSYKKYKDGEEILGFNGLKEILKPHDLDKLSELLNSKSYELITTYSNDKPRPLSREAYHGITGELIDLIEPHSEAHPAALMLNFLSGIGDLLGPNVYYEVDGAKHHLRIFTVLVGDTAKARKGTSWGHIRNILNEVDPSFKRRIQSGLSSGEGLIKAVSDTEDDKVTDKRLLVVEGEFSSVLKRASREGNTLSQIIRCAWDSGDLQTMTKNTPMMAENAHISIIGHITKEELKKYFTSTDIANGFGNRFLWMSVWRSKNLAFGGNLDKGKIKPIINRLKDVVKFAMEEREITWSKEAGPIWEREYSRLSEGSAGIIGAMTARAEAYVVRLASIYAVLDLTTEIRPEHLYAALELWRYSEDSVRYIFGENFEDPREKKVLDYMMHKGSGVSRTEINNLFNRNIESDEISMLLRHLMEEGKIRQAESQNSVGRPPEMYYLTFTH